MSTPENTAVSDALVITWRNLKRIPRIPELAIFAVLQSIMFVLLFAYVFGGAIPLPGGGNYKEFLMPGIFAQTIAFASATTAVGMTDDMGKGLIDRFRSLPMSRAAVLVGRTASDVIYNVLSVVIMAITGLLVGWRVRGSFLEALAGFAILLVFAYAISWIMAYLGLLVPSPEVINQAGFVVLFPLTFIANTFVPAENLPTVLRVLAEWNPVSAVTQASRDLFGNIPASAPTPDAWPLRHAVAYTLLWTVLVIAVFAPLSVRRYRRAARR